MKKQDGSKDYYIKYIPNPDKQGALDTSCVSVICEKDHPDAKLVRVWLEDYESEAEMEQLHSDLMSINE